MTRDCGSSSRESQGVVECTHLFRETQKVQIGMWGHQCVDVSWVHRSDRAESTGQEHGRAGISDKQMNRAKAIDCSDIGCCVHSLI